MTFLFISHLLTTIGRYVEDEDGEERDHDAGQYKGHHVEQRLPVQDEGKGEVNEGIGIATRVLEFVSLDRCLGYVPFLVFPKPLETHELRDGL